MSAVRIKFTSTYTDEYEVELGIEEIIDALGDDLSDEDAAKLRAGDLSPISEMGEVYGRWDELLAASQDDAIEHNGYCSNREVESVKAA